MPLPILRSTISAIAILLTTNMLAFGDVVLEFSAVGNDTMVTITGDLEFGGMTTSSIGGSSHILNLNSGYSVVRSGSVSGENYAVDLVPFGTAPGDFYITNDPGTWVGYNDSPTDPAGENIIMPDGYVSGTVLNISHMYTGHTLSDFGLSEGDKWGASFPVFDAAGDPTSEMQSMTFAVTAVPEPSAVLCLGLVCVLLGSRKYFN